MKRYSTLAATCLMLLVSLAPGMAQASSRTGARGAAAVVAAADSTPPAVALTAPAADASVKGTVAVTATASDAGGLAKVEFYADGTLMATDTASPYSWGWNTLGASNGSHTLTAKAYDAAGNTTTSAPVTVTVDNQRPTVQLTSPSAGSLLRQSVTVTATAADDREVARVEFLVDGVVKQRVTAAPYSWTWDTATATSAAHTLTARAYDTAGNSTTSTAVSVAVDNLAPVVRISAPASGALVKGTVNVTASASDTRMARVEFYLDGTLVSTDTISPYAYAWDTLNATPGSHTLSATAYDVVGNTATSAVTTVTVDNTQPVVELTAPAAGPVPTGTVSVTAAASDDVAVAKVEFYLDNVLKSTDTTSPYNWSWVTTSTTNGAHTLKAKAYDKAGNVATTAAVSVNVDLPPTVSLTAPKTGSLLRGAVAVTANAADAVGVTRVEFYVDGTLAGTATAAPFSITWDTTQAANGAHTLTAKAYDAGSNVTTSAAVTVTVDNAPPAVSFVAPSSGATLTGTVTVTATATDNLGVAKVEFYLDDVLKGTDNAGPYTWSWVTTTASNGSHTLKAKAYDKAGNMTVETVSVTADLPPVVTGLTLSSGLSASGTVTVTAQATDANGVTRVEFYVDGALKGTAAASPYTWDWVTTGYTNGSHTVLAKVYDAAGNMAASKTVTVKVDNAAPTVAISAPAAGANVPLKAVVTATATDNTGVTKVELYVDGTLALTDTVAPYTWTWDTTSLTPGAHVLTAKAYDAAGNVATSAPVSVTVDNQVPVISLTAPAVARQTVTISATATDPTGVTKVEFYRNGTLAQTITAAPYDWVWNTTTSTNGTYTLTAKAYDAAGNATVSAPARVAVDNQAPTVSLSAPARGALVKGAVTVTATAADNLGLATVEFYVDGTLAGTDLAAPFNLTWDTAQATDGSHVLTAKAYDTAGNVTTAAALTVTVDNTAPAVSLTGLTDGTTVTGTVTVGAAASDATALAKVEFYLDNVLKTADTVTPYTWAWQTTTATGGTHTVTARAYDTAGNVTSSAPVTVTVDLPPTASIASPKAGSLLKGTVAVTANAADAVGVTRVDLYVDQTLVTSATASPYSLTWDTTQATNGSHTLTVKAYDAGGNAATSAAVAVTVDNAAPVLALTVPADGATVTGTVNVTATASDNAAVTKVEFWLDGALKATDNASPYTWSWVTTTATNGTHTLQAKAYDAAGNVTTAAATVTVDLPPVVTGLTISSGANARGTVTVTAAASDAVGVTRVDFYVDNALKGTATASPYTWDWDTTGYTTGSHTVLAKVYDAAGNMTASRPATTKVDNGAPTVAITAPAAGSNLGVTATITATAADNVAVTKVEFYADGTLLGSDTAAPYTWTWSTAGLTGASHSVSAKAYDAAGNETTSALVTVTVDNQVPTVRVTDPIAGTALKQTVTVTAEADDNAGVTKVEFYLDGVLKSTSTAAPYTWTWNTATASNAPHALTAKAYDPTGNVATSAAVSIIVDNAAPVVGISAPANGAMVKGNVSITANATDNRGVAQVEFLVDGISMQTVTAAPWSYAWDTTTASNGTYTLQAVARDAIGNETASATTTVTVDNTVPLVTLHGLTDGATVTGTVTISVSASDNATVTKTEFYVDNTLKKTCTSEACLWDWVTTTAANGTHTVTAKAYDPAGNVGSKQVTVTVDLPPTVSLTNPTSGKALRGTVTATVTAADAVGVTRVELYANGTLVATATASPFDLTWETALAANGSYTLTAKAYDDGGNAATSAAVTVTVDNTLPEVSLTSPAQGATVTGAVQVTATATDNVGVTKVEFYLDGTLAATDNASPYAWTWATGTATDGSHSVEARAYDAAGNTATQTVGVTVDLAPTISAFTLSNGANPARGSVTVTVGASDPTGVTRVEIYLDGALKSTLTQSPYEWVWDTTAYADGSHTIQARAYDAAGNVTQSAQRTVKVDNTAPTVAVTAPADGATVPATVVVTVTAADNLGVSGVEFLLDGNTTYVDTVAPYAWPWDATGMTGTHLLQARAYDAAGNETLSAGVTVSVEGEAPAVTITSPADGAVLRQTVTVTAAAIDNVAVTTLELYVDGVRKATGGGADDLTWNTAAATNGTHSLTVKAYDAAGNVTTSDPVSVVVDNQAPAARVSAPTTGGTVMGTVAVTAAVSDNRGVTRVEFYVDGNLLGVAEASPFTVSWDTTAVANGSHTLTVMAWDAAGNVTTSAGVTVTVSN